MSSKVPEDFDDDDRADLVEETNDLEGNGQSPLDQELSHDEIDNSEISSAQNIFSNQDLDAFDNPFQGPTTTGLKDIDDQTYRYLHPLSVIFSITDLIKQNSIPAVLGIFGATQGDLFYVGLALVFFVPTFLLSLIRYFTTRYRIAGGDLIVQQGLIFRRERTIPVKRIQNIDMVQRVLHRILKLTEVRIETASGTKPEAILKVLSLDEVARLRANVQQQQVTPQSTPTAPNAIPIVLSESPDAQTQSADSSPSELLLRIPLSWLAQAGFASNRGFIMLGVAWGLYIQFDQRAAGELDGREIWDFFSLPADGGPLITAGYIALAGILVILLMRLLGVGWYILRFFGYELRQSGDDFKIACGLLTKVSATIPRQRIQLISVHRGLIMRWLGLASIRIETAGGAADSSENASTTISRRWFVPVLPESKVTEILGHVAPEIDLDTPNYHWIGLAPRAKSRFIRIACLVSLLIVIAAGIGFHWKWAIASTIAFPLLVMYGIKKSRSVKYARTDFGVVHRCGVLNQQTGFSFFEKTQVVSWRQTPFDRRWEMATLEIGTAAAGPADHLIEVKYLAQEIAKDEYTAILKRASVTFENTASEFNPVSAEFGPTGPSE